MTLAELIEIEIWEGKLLDDAVPDREDELFVEEEELDQWYDEQAEITAMRRRNALGLE